MEEPKLFKRDDLSSLWQAPSNFLQSIEPLLFCFVLFIVSASGKEIHQPTSFLRTLLFLNPHVSEKPPPPFPAYKVEVTGNTSASALEWFVCASSRDAQNWQNMQLSSERMA